MPLSEFVRYLNAQQAQPGSGLPSTTPFVAEDGRVSVHFAKLRLESCFSPIVSLADGEVYGHAAGLRVFGRNNHRLLAPDAIFVLAGDDAQFVYLDRLVRTLHTLNYLTYRQRRTRGTLLLRVHPRHVASTPAGHGLAFEEVLRSCGLLPEQITLEIEIDGGDGGDGADGREHLLRAVDNYKQRGYAVAVGRFGRRASDFDLLREVAPAIVKFDPLWVASTTSWQPLVERVHALGARVLIGGVDGADGDESTSLRGEALANGVDLVQMHAASERVARVDEAFACA